MGGNKRSNNFPVYIEYFRTRVNSWFLPFSLPNNPFFQVFSKTRGSPVDDFLNLGDDSLKIQILYYCFTSAHAFSVIYICKGN